MLAGIGVSYLLPASCDRPFGEQLGVVVDRGNGDQGDGGDDEDDEDGWGVSDEKRTMLPRSSYGKRRQQLPQGSTRVEAACALSASSLALSASMEMLGGASTDVGLGVSGSCVSADDVGETKGVITDVGHHGADGQSGLRVASAGSGRSAQRPDGSSSTSRQASPGLRRRASPNVPRRSAPQQRSAEDQLQQPPHVSTSLPVPDNLLDAGKALDDKEP